MTRGSGARFRRSGSSAARSRRTGRRSGSACSSDGAGLVGEPRAQFFYDFGSPYAYLAAERVEAVLGEEVRWSPVFLVGVYKATGRRSWGYPDHAERDWTEVRRRLEARGLPPLQLCEGWAERLIPSTTP